jgi:hypothetical protein
MGFSCVGMQQKERQTADSPLHVDELVKARLG